MKTFYSILVITCIFYVSSFAQISLPFRTLDTTLLVGATQGSANVSGSGAATYNIPIFVSPGTAGMQPSISIVYNSQATNGVLGVGWNIAGLSAISRVGRDFYHDGEVKGVTLQAGDRFEWDGNRLYSKGGSYGANGTAYATESESFAKIISNSQAGNGPESFTITTKDGTILTYGATADSRIEAPGSSTVLLWRLSKVKDINGNYIKYYYNEYSGDSYIDRIEYTGNSNTGLTPYNQIKFYYEQDKAEYIRYYVAGNSIDIKKLLTRIDIIGEYQQLIRSYSFSYIPIDGNNWSRQKNRLDKIYETAWQNGISKSVNPIQVNWGSDSNTQAIVTMSPDTTDVISLPLFGDLNGDGRTDQLILGKSATSQYYTHWYYYQSEGSTLVRKRSGYLPKRVMNGFIEDLNSDGINEIYLNMPPFKIVNCYPCSAPPLIAENNDLNLAANNNSGDMEANRIIPPPSDTCCDSTVFRDYCAMNFYLLDNSLMYGGREHDLDSVGVDNNKFLIGNINSDGKKDRFRIDNNNNLIISSVRGFTLTSIPNFNFPDKVQLMDFDGDGLDEVFVLKSGAYTVYKYDQNSTSFVVVSAASILGANATNFKTGDFNGDGKTDVVIHKTGTNKFIVRISTGNYFALPLNTPLDDVVDNSASNTEDNYYVVDLNGDGRDDILNYYTKLTTCQPSMNNDGNTSLNGSPGFVKYYSKYDGTLVLYGFKKIEDALTNNNRIFVAINDFDGDGYKDAFLGTYPTTRHMEPNFNNVTYFNFACPQRYLVSSIVNGLNQAVGFTYTSLAAANSTRYTKGKSSQFPVIDIQPAQFVVASLISHAGYMNSGNYVYSVTDFSYKGARSHLQGRGYLGFDTLVSVNNLSGLKTESVYGIKTPYYFRYPAVTNSYVSNVATGIKTTTFVTQAKGTSGYYSYPASSTSTDLLSNTTVTHKYKFDNYGNMTSDTAFIGSDAVVATNNTYAIVGDSAVPNKLSTTKTSSQYTGQAAFVTYKTFVYDAKGNLITTVDFADQAKPVTSTHTINTYGLPVSTTVSATGMASRTSYTDYDIKFRLPVRSKNALGHKSARTFNYALGVPLADSLPNGLQTTYNYDEFGRLKSTTVPQGYSITQTMNWSRTGDPSGTIFSSTTTTPGKPTVKTCYDILGRAIRSEQNGFNNKKLTADFNYVPASYYGKAGLLTSQTYPYYTSETPETVSYKYDAYGRVTKTNDRGMATLTAYSGKTVTTTNPSGQVTSKTVNALGNLVSATDNGGTINYQYHSSGQPVSIAAAGATTTIEYDAYGRQVKLIDPDAGTTKYTYNAFGELASQTNANNDKDTICYDILGRVTQKTLGTDVTTYVYNTSGPAIGQLASVTGANATKQEYAYDSYGRMNAFTQTIPGQNTKFTTSYVYDTYDNLTQITYPETGFVVKNIYENGTLVRVNKADGTLIWQVTDISSHGLPKVTQAGNNLYTAITYDMDQPASILTTGVQSETYTINHTNIGNLASRTDNLTGQTESFSYDNLNRLTNCLTPATNIAYEANGNISSKTEGGSYTYWTNKLHAVKDVVKTPGTSSQPLQNISYTKFNKALNITQYLKTTPPKTLTYNITYGPDQQRVKTIYTDTSGYKTIRYYSGSYQKDSIVVGSTKTVKKIHYIMGGTGLVAVYIKWSTGQDSMFYVCKDRQGSIVALVKQNGTVSERFSYDAWGRRRNPADWTDYNVPAPRLISRGYTGHEMLDGFGLINMNGRMYDPVIGRVLSPDNYVQDPTNTQCYNRYSYCLNNPLRYTDPSGWFASASGDNATFNISNAWADRINDVNSYIYTSAYTADNGGGGGSWTNWIHDEYTNYMLMGSGAFNRMYGNGATSVARSLTSNPSAANKWRQGLLSIESVRQAGGYYAQVAYTQKYSGPGSITIDNVTYTIQPATGGVANKWISIGTKGQGGATPAGQGENISYYTNSANSTSYAAGLSSAIVEESARGLTTTTSTVAGEVQAAKVIGKIATVAKWTGYIGNFVSGAANVVNVYNDPSAANFARAGVNGLAIGLNLFNFVVPGLGTGLSLGVSTIDMAGGFNWLYNSLETNKTK